MLKYFFLCILVTFSSCSNLQNKNFDRSPSSVKRACNKIIKQYLENNNLFPEGPRGKLKLIDRPSGGSTGGKWYEDEQNNFWFIKSDKYHHDLQTSAEVISASIYRFFNYNTPDTVKIDMNGKTYIASKDIGEKSKKTDFLQMNTQDIRQLSIVASYLKNWDRLGNPENNRLLDNQKLILIDFGGSLGSRAKGEHKPGKVFSDGIGNYEATDSIDTIDTIYDSFYIFADDDHPWLNVTHSDAVDIIEKFKNLDDIIIDKIVESAKYSLKEDSNFMKKALKMRRDGIINHLLESFSH